MDRVELIYLKAAIDSIPILTQENFSLWHTRVINYLDLQGLKEFFLDSKGKLEEVDKKNVRILITSKLDPVVHANVINHSNKDDIELIWKSINEYFASQHSANRARVWNHFSYLSFDSSDVDGFITRVKSAI
ncbi:hypothetical protein VP01_1314g7 [Puccinia sorghi]|uniref:Uncharacterized protein n=1 Tax=Puccinia sorghi TaxID=27349 RepID=A0A0L6VN19_9BASI|nr:hypothetical protein VP01_1314g7 [Puccinia sorghi]